MILSEVQCSGSVCVCVCVVEEEGGGEGGPHGFQKMYEPPLNLGT